MQKQVIWHPNNGPTDYEKLAVWLESGQKEALVNYTASCGSTLSTVVRRLVERLLTGEIDLKFKPPVRVMRAKK